MPSPIRCVRVGERLIGEANPIFIIAEAGSNHNGSLDRAKQLVDAAAGAGADAVKFQLFRADKLYPRHAGKSDYLKVDRSIYDVIVDMEMPYDWLGPLADHCRERGLFFLASVFDEESADRLDDFVQMYKVASYEMTHLPLVRHIARKNKPVAMATGTAHLDEVRESVAAFLETGNDKLMLMQCTAAYPAPLSSLNVRAVVSLQETFGIPVGLSDHSRDPLVGPLAAAAVGANLLEKHFTLSRDLPGPDHGFALEPGELALMIQKVREVEQALGTGEKSTQPVEEELRRFARRHIFAVKDIRAGERFTAENIAVLRTGQLAPGLAPRHYEELLGKAARRTVPSGQGIQRDDVG